VIDGDRVPQSCKKMICLVLLNHHGCGLPFITNLSGDDGRASMAGLQSACVIVDRGVLLRQIVHCANSPRENQSTGSTLLTIDPPSLKGSRYLGRPTVEYGITGIA